MPPVSTFSEFLVDIAHIVTCLFEFSIATKNPAPRDRLEKYSQIPVKHFEIFDVSHAKHKFPECQESTLIERLGKANTRRRQMLRYYKEHHERIVGPQEFYVLTSIPKISDGVKTMDNQPLAPKSVLSAPDPDGSKSVVTKISQTTVSTYVQRIIEKTDKHSDTEVSQTSYATSAGGSEATLHLLRVPPPLNPDESLEGDPFQCPYCYELVKITSQYAWKYVFS